MDSVTDFLPETTLEKKMYWNSRRCTWFGCILYPDEDRKHATFIDFIKKSVIQYPSYVYIVHDRDIVTQSYIDEWVKEHTDIRPPEIGSLKKKHVHLIFKRYRSCPVTTVSRFFGCWVKHFEPISDSVSYISYMLHTNPLSLEEGKPIYQPSELVGDQKVIRLATIQNAKSVQYNEIFDIINNSDFGGIKQLIDNIRFEKPDLFISYLDAIKQYQFIINQYAREVREDKLDEARIVANLQSFDPETREAVEKLFWKGKRYR